MGSTDNTKWGNMSLVTKDQNPFMRRHNELSWVLEHKADSKLTQVPTDFPPMIIHVLDTILLRGAFHEGVVAMEIVENFGTSPDNFGTDPCGRIQNWGEPPAVQGLSIGSATSACSTSSVSGSATADANNPISISVTHRGERIPFNDSNNDSFISLTKMVANFPPSFYEIEINAGAEACTYKQVFTEHSGTIVHGEPTIQHSEDKSSWTKVTFKPNLEIFNITYDGLAIGRYFWRRCIDIAGTLRHLKVKVSGAELNSQNFDQYVDRCYPQFTLEMRPNAPKRVHEKVVRHGHNWEVSIGRSHGEFEQVSFVNGFPTPNGGPHVELVKSTLVLYAKEVEKKYNLGFDLQDVCVFINLINSGKPKFSLENDSLLTDFASDYTLEFSIEFVDKFAEILRGLGPIALNRSITNLIDATEAGGKQSGQCYLILTEGESAKNFALAGHEVLGTQFYGVLSLRGKIPNAKRNESSTFEHPDVMNITASLGLEKGVFYNSAKKLRYGHLMLMMDQDHDGSHIKGLIINLLHTFWPSLLKIEFLSQFVTPVIKVKVQTTEELHEFYSIPEFNIWAKKRNDQIGMIDWTSRYYKGLASHDPEDVLEYMQEYMSKEYHVKPFTFSGPRDFNAINLAFSENRVHDRRQWIMAFEEGTFLDLTPKRITYSDFFNKEFILYSIEDIKRSIPSMVDGLKPSQRKALFTALKTNTGIEKVEDFAGDVCKECQYHHGQVNMRDTVIGMAQKYVGTNNINLFVPKGIFGTRREGTKSDARYLSIMVSPMTRCIFMEEDDTLLSHRVEDGKQVQPDWFLPVIPMALVNGCEGIGTGWSTKITKYHPVRIVENLMNILTGQETKPLVPWFNGFKGNVETREGLEASYIVSGVATVVEFGKVQISELPLETKFDKFKSDLDLLITDGHIKSYDEHHRGDDINFVVEFTDDQFQKAETKGFDKLFKLSGSINTDNMHLIDEKGLITKYSSPDEILSSFRDFRLPFYEKRKIMSSKQLGEKRKKLENIKRYIEEYNEDKFSRKPDVFMEQLRNGGYALPDDKSFDYLLRLPLAYYIDKNTINKLDTECKFIIGALEKLEGKTASDLWMADLEALKQKLALFYQGEIMEDPEFRPRKRPRTGT